MDRAPLLSEAAEGPEGGAAWWLYAIDGTRLRVGAWPGGDRGTVLLFPGRTEYIEKYGRTAADLAARGFGTLAVDWRGQGLADRPAHRRDIGHVTSFNEYREDVAAVRAAAQSLDLPRPWFLLGHSMGAAIGLRALHDGLQVSAAAFTGPMWGIRMSGFMRAISGVVLGLSKPLGLDRNFAPTTGPAEPMIFDGNPLTADRDMFDYLAGQVDRHPELALGGPSITWVNAAIEETDALMAMPAPANPAISFIGTSERIVEISAVEKRMAAWPGGKLEVLPGALHEVLMEAPEMRGKVTDAIAEWYRTHS